MVYLNSPVAISARHVGTSCLEEGWDGQNDRQSNNLSSFLAHHYTISIPVLKRNTCRWEYPLIGSSLLIFLAIFAIKKETLNGFTFHLSSKLH